MKKLFVFFLTFCLLLSLAACAKPAEPEVQEDPIHLWIETNGETVIPYKHCVWSESYAEDGSGLSADGVPFLADLANNPHFMKTMPAVTYADDLMVFLGENVTTSGFSVYNMDHVHILDETSFSALKNLPAGEYIVEISIKVRGDYVEAADSYNASGYDCIFLLTMPDAG